jgi:hypothetical protein
MQETNGNGQNGHDLNQRFATLSRAVVVKTEKTEAPVSAHQQLLEDPPPDEAEQKKTYLSDRSKLTRKIPFHRDKRTKLVALIIIGLGLSTAAGALTMGKFGVPRWSRDTKAKPVARRDGGSTWQRSRFANAMQPLEQPSPPPFQKDTAKPKPKPSAKGKTVRTARVAPTPTSTSVLRRPAIRTAYVPPDNPQYPRRMYTPSIIRGLPRPAAAPAPAIRPSSKPAQSESKVQELSPEERRKAAIAATTALTSGASGDAAPQSPAGQPGSVVQSTNSVPQPSNPVDQALNTGYQEASFLASETAVIDDIPQHLVGRGQQAKGRLMTGFVFLPGDVDLLKGQTVDIEITDSMQTGLPAGSRIVAEIELPQSGGQLTSAPFRLKPVGIAIGDAEYPLPQNTIRLSGSKGKPLVAKRQGSAFLRFLGGLAQSLVGGAGSLFTGSLGNNSVISTVAPQVLNDLTGKSGGQQQATEVLAVREDAPIQVDLMAPLSLPAEIVSQSATPSPSGPETIPEAPQPAVLAPKPELTSQSLPESVAQDPGFGSTSQPPSEPVFPQSEDQQVALTDQQIDEVIQGEINNAAIPEAVQFQQISQPAESTSIEAVDQPIP